MIFYIDLVFFFFFFSANPPAYPRISEITNNPLFFFLNWYAELDFSLSFIDNLPGSRKFTQAMKSLSKVINGPPRVQQFDHFCGWPQSGSCCVGYGHQGRVRDGFQVFERLTEMGFVPNVNTCNCLLNRLLKLGFVELCWVVYEDMEELGSLQNLLLSIY